MSTKTTTRQTRAIEGAATPIAEVPVPELITAEAKRQIIQRRIAQLQADRYAASLVVTSMTEVEQAYPGQTDAMGTVKVEAIRIGVLDVQLQHCQAQLDALENATE